MMLRVVLFTCFVAYALGDAPILVSGSNDQLKGLGASAIIFCSFESALKLTMTWQKDGVSLQDTVDVYSSKLSSTMTSLNFAKLKSTDEGVYSCVATNDDGKIKADIDLKLIKIKPNITTIKDVYLRTGQSINITCAADAVPAASYTWTLMQDVMNSNVRQLKDVLEIKGATDDNIGTYQCTATNVVGSDRINVKVDVIKSTKWLDPKPKSDVVVSASKNKQYELVVDLVTTDTRMPKITWYKNSILVSNVGSTMKIINANVGARYTSRLYFSELSMGNSGVYKVTIGLQTVSEFSHETNLTVLSKPVIAIEEVAIFTEVGLSPTLTCSVTALPAPEIEWRRNNTVLSTSKNAVNNVKVDGIRTTFVLILSNVEFEDADNYTCYAKNSEGESVKNVKLSVAPERTLSGGTDDETIIIVVVVVSIIVIIVIVLAAFLYIRYRDRWCANPYEQANGAFYTDLVQEEKDVSTLADIENNPYAIKKNINISIRHAERTSTMGSRLQQDPTTKGRSLRQSIKQGMSLRQGMSLKRPPSQTAQQENHYARLDTLVCQGKAIDFRHIVFDELLGSGEYGMVNGGRVIDDENATVFKEVSIKMLKENCRPQDRRDMLTELRMMRRVAKHKNVISLIGWCIAEENVYVIEEFVPFGSVLTFLRAQRCLNQSREALDQLPMEDRVDEKTLLSFASQVADGMKHLSGLQVIHRDLACRNVYLGFEKTCKISEYGLIRDIYAENVYRKTTGGQLPVRWMARESVFEGLYTHQSDVWSFGILLWELITLGKIPYPGIVRTEHLLDEMEAGYHMENPGHISTELYLIMSSCWNREPESRPTFDTLQKKLTQLLQDSEEVHIDLEKMLNSEMEDNIAAEDFVRSPTGDFHRPQFNSMKEQPEEEEQAEKENHENSVKT